MAGSLQLYKRDEDWSSVCLSKAGGGYIYLSKKREVAEIVQE